MIYLSVDPLLEILRDGTQLTLRLYAAPAASYTVESTDSLTEPAPWTPLWSGPSSNLVETIQITPTNGVLFLRATQP